MNDKMTGQDFKEKHCLYSPNVLTPKYWLITLLVLTFTYKLFCIHFPSFQYGLYLVNDLQRKAWKEENDNSTTGNPVRQH